MMKYIGNILWFLLGGLMISIMYFLIGLLLCVTIIGIPFGIQCFKLAELFLFPFGKEVRIKFDEHPVANMVWLILFGWELSLSCLVAGALLYITIVGIPFAIQWFKLARLSLLPFGAVVE
jgi:uncharacterized membrane protein YccF (DUF307 family)